MVDFRCAGERGGVRCPEILHAADEHRGRLVRCARCGELNLIPQGLRNVPGPIYVAPHLSLRRSRQSQFAVITVTILGMVSLIVLLVGGLYDATNQRVTRSADSAMVPGPGPAQLAPAASSVPPTQPIPTRVRNQGAPTKPVHTNANAPTVGHDSKSAGPDVWSEIDTILAESPGAPNSVRPPTGTQCSEQVSESALGKLTIENGTATDAAVFAFTGAGIVRCVYVRHGETATLEHMEAAVYRVQFTTGEGWNPNTREFQRDAGFSEFDDSFAWHERHEQGSLNYDKHTVTLHSIPNGNVRVRTIRQTQFIAFQSVR
jgi:hypothetical protein